MQNKTELLTGSIQIGSFGEHPIPMYCMLGHIGQFVSESN